MARRTACLLALVLLGLAAAPAPAAEAERPQDRLGALAAIPEMPLQGDFYLVKQDDPDGPSYIRAPSAGEPDAAGWLLEVLTKPEPTDKGPAAYVAGYFRFDCEAKTARIFSLVYYSREGREVDRLNEQLAADFVETSPIWLLMEAACRRSLPDADRLADMEAVLADAKKR